MVVTNYEPQYGEDDPVDLMFRVLDAVAKLDHDQEHHDICYPVDGDMLNRARVRVRLGQDEDATRWAQESLHIDRMGITGRWVHEVAEVFPLAWRPPGHEPRRATVWAYRRWAEL